MPKEAVDVHGLTDDILRDKPVFAAIAQDFLAFIGDAKLVIHNAAFDMKFLNAELRWLGLPQIDEGRAIDTLEIARRRFPGSPRVTGCPVPTLWNRQFKPDPARSIA